MCYLYYSNITIIAAKLAIKIIKFEFVVIAVVTIIIIYSCKFIYV